MIAASGYARQVGWRLDILMHDRARADGSLRVLLPLSLVGTEEMPRVCIEEMPRALVK